MNLTTEQRTKKAEQLRLAAQIIETGCEWDYKVPDGRIEFHPSEHETDSSRLGFCIQHGYEIRILPGQIKQPLAWKLPAHPEGRKWHREDWTQEMLPDGWRPLLDGETIQLGDQGTQESPTIWVRFSEEAVNHIPIIHARTRRPLPTPVIPVLEGYRELRDDEKDGRWIDGAKYSMDKSNWEYNARHKNKGAYANSWNRIIVPLPKPRVPLEPGDVPPGSVIRGAGEAKEPNHKGWCMITSCSETGIRYWRGCEDHQSEWRWRQMMEDDLQIKRPTDTEWQPASKPAP